MARKRSPAALQLDASSAAELERRAADLGVVPSVYLRLLLQDPAVRWSMPVTVSGSSPGASGSRWRPAPAGPGAKVGGVGDRCPVCFLSGESSANGRYPEGCSHGQETITGGVAAGRVERGGAGAAGGRLGRGPVGLPAAAPAGSRGAMVDGRCR